MAVALVPRQSMVKTDWAVMGTDSVPENVVEASPGPETAQLQVEGAFHITVAFVAGEVTFTRSGVAVMVGVPPEHPVVTTGHCPLGLPAPVADTDI